MEKGFGVGNDSYIKKYLEDYINDKVKLEQAILISGKWGSGKTFFIRELEKEFSEKYNNIKIINISLFGIKSINDIQEKIFEEFHPVLSNKNIKIIREILKGALKIRFNFDFEKYMDELLNKEISKYVELNENKISSNILGYLFDNKKYDISNNSQIIFIFDDLERIIEDDNFLNEVLGYINMLVERKKVKVILIADEEKFINNREKYQNFKEKVIAKTFYIDLDYEAIIEEIIKEFDNYCNDKSKNCKNFLLKYKNDIYEIFLDSKEKNLRVLKQVLTEWCYLYCQIENYILQKERFIDFFMSYLIIYMEHKINSGLLRDDLGKLQNIKNSDINCAKELKDFDEFKKKKKEKNYNITNVLRCKYSFFSQDLIFDGKIWYKIIYNEFNDINDILKKRKEFREEKKEKIETKINLIKCWDVICNYYEYDEQKFNECLKTILEDFQTCNVNTQWIINEKLFLNVVNTLLFFIDEKIIELDKNIIYKKAKKCINFLSENISLCKNAFDERYYFMTKYRYYDENSFPFKEIKDYLINKKNECYQKFLKMQHRKELNNLIKAIEKGDTEFIVSLLLEKYRYESFFIDIDYVVEFINTIKMSNLKNVVIFFQILNERFNDNYTVNGKKNWMYLKGEKNFFDKLNIELEKLLNEIDKKSNKRLVLKNFVKNTLNLILKKLNNETS